MRYDTGGMIAGMTREACEWRNGGKQVRGWCSRGLQTSAWGQVLRMRSGRPSRTAGLRLGKRAWVSASGRSGGREGAQPSRRPRPSRNLKISSAVTVPCSFCPFKSSASSSGKVFPVRMNASAHLRFRPPKEAEKRGGSISSTKYSVATR